MKGNEEFEKLLNVEIPQSLNQNFIQQQQRMNHLHHSSPNQPIQGTSHTMYENDPSFHHNYSWSSSSVGGFSMQSESSNSSSLLSDGFHGFHETSPRFEEAKTQTHNRNTRYSNGFGLESKLPNTPTMTDELGLSGLLSRMSIRDIQNDLRIKGHPPSHGFQLDMRTNNGNVDNRGLHTSFPVSPMNFEEEDMRLAILDLQEIYAWVDLSEGYYTHGDCGLYSQLDDYTCSMRASLKEAMANLRAEQVLRDNLNNLRIQEQNLYLARHGTYCNEVRGVLDSPSSPQVSLDYGCRSLHSPPMSNLSPVISPNGRILHSPSSVINVGGHEVYTGEDSMIFQGQSLNHGYNKSCDLSSVHKKHSFNEICTGNPCDLSSLHKKHSFNEICIGNPSVPSLNLDCLSHTGGIPSVNCEYGRSPKIHYPHLGQPKCKSLWEVQRRIYFLAKQQPSCRLLQEKFDKRNPQYVKLIFYGIINHVSELMMDPFGNYLMQKLLDVCTEGQRTDIILMITRVPDEFIRISIDTHGTRVVQKLIHTLKTRRQISQVISALEFGFIDLSKDPNGTHVVQSCLSSLSYEDNKFIFSAAAKFCLEIATHQHGCCVLQRCINHSFGERRENLAAKIAANGLLLAQDAYGNYVVQYIIEQKISSATKTLVSQFQGKYVHLSMQKFSSNVVETCLKQFDDENIFKIIQELVINPRFDQLLQHQFANYVVQTALMVSKGRLNSLLVGAIVPYEEKLKNNIHSKRLISRSRLVK